LVCPAGFNASFAADAGTPHTARESDRRLRWSRRMSASFYGGEVSYTKRD
jgi:hypothetical protein